MKSIRKTFAAVALAVTAAVGMTGCYDTATAQRALDDAGYTDVQTGGHAFFMCGKDDSFATKFTAKNSNGKPVAGAVCSGLFMKGATIRF